MEKSGMWLSALALLLPILSSIETGHAGTISDRLKSRLSGLDGRESVPIIITFAQRIDPLLIRRSSSSVGGMIRSLRESIGKRHENIRDRVREDWQPGQAKLFWINQSIAMTATRRLIERLALDPAIDMIDGDEASFSQEPHQYSAAELTSPSAVPWNITITGVDSVWNTYGLDGTGILIGSLDTGIDPSHPALADKLRVDDSWKDFIFGLSAPYDNLGHGTFGSGILVGGNGPTGTGPGVGIGIAYRARLIVGKILDAGSSTISQVTSGMQWILDPDGDPDTDDFPRVVNNSWFSGTRGSMYAYAAASAWRAAGIIPVFCAGNSGPASATTRSPADYKNCISVGGTDINDDRYDNTSVGPSPPDTNYFPADGRKPDLSAPGEGISSSQQGGGYSTSSGTSWSAPHVTAIIALMLQANPTLDYARVMSMLKLSAFDLGTGGYDHVFGYGRISAMGSVREALRSRVSIQADPVLQTSEPGGGSHFDVVLEVVPNDTVCISLTSTDTTEGSVGPGFICFNPDNWNTPQRVYVTGKDDSTKDGDIGYSITMNSTSNDVLYDGIEPAPVIVVNLDDEDAVYVTVGAGWNLVSLPTALGSSELSLVFPTSVSPAYAYTSEYFAVDSLRRGAGYWLKFDVPRIVPVLGDTTSVETVAVVPGWNLIGSLSAPVTPSDITSEPPNLATSHFYGYDAGYLTADTIKPGHGYWVKVAEAGKLILQSDSTISRMSAIRIIHGHGQPPR